MDKWSEIVRKRAERWQPLLPIDNIERITTACIEQVVSQINFAIRKKLVDEGQLLPSQAMPEGFVLTAQQALNATDREKTGDYRQIKAPSLYPSIVMQVARVFLDRLESGKEPSVPSTVKDTIREISTYFDGPTELQNLLFFFMEHPQISMAGIESPEQLRVFIQANCRDMIRDAFLKKPSNPIDKDDLKRAI